MLDRRINFPCFLACVTTQLARKRIRIGKENRGNISFSLSNDISLGRNRKKDKGQRIGSWKKRKSLVMERAKQSAARIFSFNYAQLSMLLLAKVQPIRNVSLLLCRMERWSNRVVSYRAAATSCSLSTNHCQKQSIDLQHLRHPRSTTRELFSSRADSFYFFGGEPSFDQCG